MAIVVEDSTQASAAGATTLAVTTPTGCQAGEVLVLVIASFAFGSGELPENAIGTDPENLGWSQVFDSATAGTSDAVDAGTAVWARFATDDEPATQTFSLFGTEDVAAVMLRLSGVDLGQIVDGFTNSGSVGNGTAGMVAPDTTTNTANALLFTTYASNGTGGAAASHSTPTGMTEAEEVSVDTSTLSVCTEIIAAAGATGTRTSTRSTTNQRALSTAFAIRAGDPIGNLTLVGQAGAHRTTTGTTLSVNVPGSVVDGDLLIASLAVEGDANGSNPVTSSGWTVVAFTDGDDGAGKQVTTTMLYRVASSEPGSYSFAWADASKAAGVIVAFRNAATLDVTTVDHRENFSSPGSLYAPTLATRPDSFYVGAVGYSPATGSPMNLGQTTDGSGALMHLASTGGSDDSGTPMAAVILGYGATSPFVGWTPSSNAHAIVALEVMAVFQPTPQTRGVLREARTKGAFLSQVGAVTPDITGQLFDLPDLVTPVVALDQARKVRWVDEVSEPGSGGFALQLTDPDLASFSADGTDLVTFYLRGWAALTMICEKYVRHTIEQGEEKDQVIDWSGRGHLALLERMIVYPWRGVGRYPIEEDRTFNWSSPSYIDTWWPNATAIAGVGTGLWWAGLPPAWPGGGSWIWAHSGSQDWAPTGTCYFRKTFTLAADARIRIFLAIDDAGTLYFDGAPVISTSNIPGGDPDGVGAEPREIRDVILLASAGDHVIAIEGYNAPDDPANPLHHNPGGVLVSVWTVDGTGALLAEVLATDGSWLIVEYPPWPPGMTPGQVMRIVVEEGQARGVLPTLTLGFTDNVDTEGVPWPEVSDIATKVGTDTLTFFREIAGTYTDMWMQVGQLRLDAWNIGGRGVARAGVLLPPADPTDPTSGNLTQLTHTGEV